MKPNSRVRFYEQQTLDLYDPTMTSGYRQYDESFIHTPSYRHIAGIIRQLSMEFTHPYAALDIGCGTGRYFHALHRPASLTGIDVSAHMLKEAARPFGSLSIAPDQIALIEGNFYNYDFGTKTFDFIYSVGVLGEHAVFDAVVARKLYRLLRPGGSLFFTVVDLDSRKTLKRRIAEAVYPFLPRRMRRVLDQRWETVYMTEAQLESIMRQEHFSSYSIHRHVSEDPKWKGVHLECVAVK